MNPDRKTSLSLENLLQLKRAEQPRPEFWADFDKELRAKQLVAIMERRPRWGGLSRILGSMVRHPAPIGAAAALVLTTLGYREYHSIALHRVENPAVAPLPAPIPVVSAPAPIVAATDAIVPVAARATPRSASADQVAVAAPVPKRTEATESSESAIRIDGEVPTAVSFNPSSSVRAVAATFALATAPDSQLGRNLFGPAQMFSTGNHIQVARNTVVDPLARMASPASERRARILTMDTLPAAGAQNDEPAATSSDRLVNRLSDERLYESISRYGAGGDHFSVKF